MGMGSAMNSGYLEPNNNGKYKKNLINMKSYPNLAPFDFKTCILGQNNYQLNPFGPILGLEMQFVMLLKVQKLN